MSKNILLSSLIACCLLILTIIGFATLTSPSATAQDQPPPAADLSRTDVIKLIAVTDFAKLRGVNLQGVDLSKLDLRNADLSFANLTDTDFSEANLFGANMACATVSDHHFDGAIMPNGDIFSPALDMSQFFGAEGGDCITADIAVVPDSDTVLYISIVSPSDPTAGVDALCGQIPSRQAAAFGRTGDTQIDLLTALQSALDERNIANANSGVDPLIAELVSIDGDHATIDISGQLGLAGACDDAYVEAQIALTVFLYPDINTATITLNDINLRQLLFGATGAELPDNAVYTRADIEAEYLP